MSLKTAKTNQRIFPTTKAINYFNSKKSTRALWVSMQQEPHTQYLSTASQHGDKMVKVYTKNDFLIYCFLG